MGACGGFNLQQTEQEHAGRIQDLVEAATLLDVSDLISELSDFSVSVSLLHHVFSSDQTTEKHQNLEHSSLFSDQYLYNRVFDKSTSVKKTYVNLIK